jgi:hypothetical protein
MPSPSVHHDYSIDLVKIRLFPEMHTDWARSERLGVILCLWMNRLALLN